MAKHFQALSDERVLAVMGDRIEQERLQRDMTQTELASRAGIGLRTLKKFEAGQPTSLLTFLAILRGLELLDRMDLIVPEVPISPVQLAKLKGKRRKRASGKSSSTKVAETRAKWEWNE